MDTPITRAEYEEHNRRMEDEHHRMNRRIELAEEEIRSFQKLATSVEKLATGMENMTEEQKRQGDQIGELKDHIDQIEKSPGKTWTRIKDKALDTAVGLIFGAFITGAVFMIVQYIK